jgi:hypothetical protein
MPDMAASQLRCMTPDEFYRWHSGDENRYALVDDLPRMMTGASLRHDAVVVNAIAALRQKLHGSRCRPSTADIAFRSPNGNIRRPDVTVECAPIREKSYESSAPEFDGSRSLFEYLNTPSLRYVLLVETTTPQVLFQSRIGGCWNYRGLTRIDDVISEASHPRVARPRPPPRKRRHAMRAIVFTCGGQGGMSRRNAY